MSNSVDPDETAHLDHLDLRFFIVKQRFTGVSIIFLILLKTHKILGSQNRLAEAVLTSTHNLCIEQEYETYQNFLSENFPSL